MGLFWGGFTFRLVVLPLGVPSFAPICGGSGGLHGRTGLHRALLSSDELPIPVTKLMSSDQINFSFSGGCSSHSLPVEQGRIEMPQVPRHLRRCTFCATNDIGKPRRTSTVVSLIALILRALGSSMQRFPRILMMP